VVMQEFQNSIEVAFHMGFQRSPPFDNWGRLAVQDVEPVFNINRKNTFAEHGILLPT